MKAVLPVAMQEAMTMPPPTFLSLPQELRDLIYGYAILSDEIAWPDKDDGFEETVLNTGRGGCGAATTTTFCGVRIEREAFRVYVPRCAPRSSWFALMRTCRQVRDDVEGYLKVEQGRLLRRREHRDVREEILEGDGNAEMNVRMTSTTATITWRRFTCHPTNSDTLKMRIELEDLWDMDNLSSSRDNKILRVVFDTLKRYLANGPHLSRPSPLDKALPQLETLILDIGPSMGRRGGIDGLASLFLGEAGLQREQVYRVFLGWITLMRRIGLLKGRVRDVKVRMRMGVEGEYAEQVFHLADAGGKEDEGIAERALLDRLGYVW